MELVKTLQGLSWGIAQGADGPVLFVTIDDEYNPNAPIFVNISITPEDLEYALNEFRKGYNRILH